MSLINKVSRTISILLLGSGQEVIFQVLSTLVWVGAWGIDVYSEWIILFIFPNLITRGNAGVFHTATTSLIDLHSRKEYEKASGIYLSLKYSHIVLLGIVGVIFALLSGLLLVTGYLKQFSFADVVQISCLLFSQIALFHFQQQYLCLLKAEQRAPEAALWQNCYRLALILPMLALPFVLDAAHCLIVAVAAQLIVVLVTRTQVAKIENLLPQLDSSDMSTSIKLFVQGVRFSSLPFTQTAMHSVSVWALGYFMGPAIGAAWHNMRTISRGILLVARAVEQALRWEMSGLFSLEKVDQAVDLLRRFLIITSFALTSISLLLVVVGDEIFNFITHGELEFSPVVFVSLCIGALFYSLSQIYLAIPFAINRFEKFVNEYLLISIVALVLVAPVSSHSLVGLALMLTVTDFLVVLRSRRYAKKIICEM